MSLNAYAMVLVSYTSRDILKLSEGDTSSHSLDRGDYTTSRGSLSMSLTTTSQDDPASSASSSFLSQPCKMWRRYGRSVLVWLHTITDFPFCVNARVSCYDEKRRGLSERACNGK